jgi:hypothetical protein
MNLRRRRGTGIATETVVANDHPLHDLLHRTPEIRLQSKRVTHLAARIERQVASKDWVAFLDHYSARHGIEIETAYDIGVKEGNLRGRTEALRRLANRQPGGDHGLRRAIRSVLMRAQQPPLQAATTLIELAWALLTQEPDYRRG